MPLNGPSPHFRFDQNRTSSRFPSNRANRCGADTPVCAPPKAANLNAECGMRNAERDEAAPREHRASLQLRRFAPRADRSVCATLADATAHFSVLNSQFAVLLFCVLASLLTSSLEAAPPRRIVTLVPSAAEILDGLGIAERIVGVTDYTDFPASMESLPRIGAFNNLNVEAIVALHPDLAVATSDGNSAAVLDRLRRLGIEVFVLDLRYWKTTRLGIVALGRKTGRAEAGKALVAEMDRVAACVATRTKRATRPRVLFAFDMNPVIAPGRDSFTNELIGMAGGFSVTKSNPAPYPRLSAEGLIALAPDVVVVSTMNPSNDLEAWRAWLGRWPAIPAVKSGAIRMVDSRTIDRPSHRLVIGLRELAASLHPELFPKGVCRPDWSGATK
jgi:iron complex transport system substrate-binding protein